MPSSSGTRPNPYAGPRAFTTGERLYGRDHEVQSLLDLLIAERIVWLYSPSGAGKTSLVQAGLVPQLKQEGFHVLPVVRVSLDAPPVPDGRLPVRNRYVLSALLSLEEGLPEDQRVPLPALAGMALTDYVAHQRSRWDEAQTDVVLLLDQFEEILTVNLTDQEAKHEFFNQLGALLRDRRHWALFSMREEYVAGMDPYLRAIPNRMRTTFRLDLLGQDGARQAIQQPARQAGVDFTDAAAHKLMDNLRQIWVQTPDGETERQLGPHVEPVQLQVVCCRLWQHLPADDREIGEDDIEEVGEVDSALAGYYADQVRAIAGQTEARERDIREWVDQHLITGQGIRGQVLRGPQSSDGLLNEAIEGLEDAHLVRAESRHGSTWFELAHDRLIGPVRANNAAWYEAHLSPLQQQARVWDAQARSSGLLLRDQAFTEATRWADEHPGELTDTEMDFLQACREKHNQFLREQRHHRIVRWMSMGLSVFSVIAILTAVWALRESWEAKEARAKARIRLLSAESRVIRESDRQRSVLLAVEAVASTGHGSDSADPAAEQALRSVMGTFQWYLLIGHRGPVLSAMFSADGKRLVTGGQDGTARMWDLGARDPGAAGRVLDGSDSALTCVALAPDGRLMRAGDERGAVHRWNLDDDASTTVASRDPERGGRSLAITPDGETLVTAGQNHAVQVWDLRADAPAQPHVLKGHGDTIRAAALTPDGRWLATASDDGTARLWNLSSEDPSATAHVFSDHSGGVTALALSADGSRLATGGKDAKVRVRDMAVNAGARTFSGHHHPIQSVALTSDGHYVIAGAWDGTTRMWDIDVPARVQALRGHKAPTGKAALSPDGRWLATSGWDGVVRLWDLHAGNPPTTVRVLLAHHLPVSALAITASGRWLVTGTDDNTASVWDLQAGVRASPRVLSAHICGIEAVAITPDARWLVTGSDDNTARVWDLRNEDSPGANSVLREHKGSIWAVAITPDATRVVTGSDDNTARVWNLQNGAATGTSTLLSGHKCGIMAVAITPDGRRVVTGSVDTTAQVWDVPDRGPAVTAQVLQGHGGPVRSVAISPDGGQVVTGGDDDTARVWDLRKDRSSPDVQVLRGHVDAVLAVTICAQEQCVVTQGEGGMALRWDLKEDDPSARVRRLRCREEPVWTAAVSPDGRWLVTGTEDGAAKLWPLPVQDLLAHARVAARRNLSHVEWDTYFPGEPYRKTFPDLPTGEGIGDDQCPE